MPYDRHEIRRLNIPDVSEVAQAIVPLICYAIVEWHPIDRVMRQFGMHQGIPQEPPNFDRLHRIDMRGKTDVHWPDRHRQWIDLWDDRHNRIVRAVLFSGVLHENSDYMQWYIRHTRRYMTRMGACTAGTVLLFSHIQNFIKLKIHIMLLSFIANVSYKYFCSILLRIQFINTFTPPVLLGIQWELLIALI